ncbi:hypothetical protein BGZ54_007104 [Gamsiella multidivaricata]|nr:hypothetical protein BGZ54_007104 [Gamsiella multidivaricata]
MTAPTFAINTTTTTTLSSSTDHPKNTTNKDTSMNANMNTNINSQLPSPTSPTATTFVSNTTTEASQILHKLLRALPPSAPVLEGRTSSSSTTEQDLREELDNLKQLSTEAQQTYMIVHGLIQQYQQLVLSTHAQVAAAKQALIHARGTLSSSSSSSSTSSLSSQYYAGQSYPQQQRQHQQHQQGYSSTSSGTSSPPLSPPSSGWSRAGSFSSTFNYLSPTSTSQNYSFPDGVPSHHQHQYSHHHQHQYPDHHQQHPYPEHYQQHQHEDDEERVRRLSQEHTDLGYRLSQLLRDKAAAEETKKRLNDGLVKVKARIREIGQTLAGE